MAIQEISELPSDKTQGHIKEKDWSLWCEVPINSH